MSDLMEECSKVLTEHYAVETTVSRRQIFNDIDFMKSDAGYEAPIDSIKDGRKVYYRYSEADFSILKRPLTQEEQIVIENTIELLSRMKGIPGVEGLESLETKLISTKENATTHDIISFEENEFLTGLNYLADLYNYIKNKQVLKIQYKSFKSEETQTFIISPYHLKQYNNRWFLFGQNHVYNNIQNIALDRFVGIEMIQTDFLENTIDFEEYFEDIIGVTNEANKTVEQIAIELTNNIIPYVVSKPLHGSQKVKGNKLTLDLKWNYELETLILSYGENMKVIAPVFAVEKIKERVNKMKLNY